MNFKDRFQRRTLAVVAGGSLLLAAGSWLAVANSGAAEPGTVAPVSSGVLAVLNGNGNIYVSADPAASPAVPEAQAVATAASDAPWAGTVTGASLVETSPVGDPTSVSTLAWLVSIQPNDPVYKIGGAVDTRATATSGFESPGPTANYFVVVIDATSGAFLHASDGYSPNLAG